MPVLSARLPPGLGPVTRRTGVTRRRSASVVGLQNGVPDSPGAPSPWCGPPQKAIGGTGARQLGPRRCGHSGGRVGGLPIAQATRETEDVWFRPTNDLTATGPPRTVDQTVFLAVWSLRLSID